MKFTLDAFFDLDDSVIDSASLVKTAAERAEPLEDVARLEGQLSIKLDGEEALEAFSEPIVRLMDAWLRKLPWIIGGDTETVALRNSEQCFAFVPAGESVELSFFTGTETEIEDYQLEPVNVKLDAFITESLSLGERLVALIEATDASLLTEHEDCRDLRTSLGEAQRAWHERQLHARR